MKVWEVFVYIIIPTIIVIICLLLLWKRYQNKKKNKHQTKSVEQIIEEFRKDNDIEPFWYSSDQTTPEKNCSTEYEVGKYTLTQPFNNIIQHWNSVLESHGLKPKYTPVQQQGITTIDYDLSDINPLITLLEIPKESTFQVSIRSVRSLHDYMMEGKISVFRKDEKLLSMNMNISIVKQELVSYFKLCATPYNQNSWLWSWFQSRPNIQTLLNTTHINKWLLSTFSTQGIAPASPGEAIWKITNFPSNDLRSITNSALQKKEFKNYPSTKTSIPDIIEDILHDSLKLPKDLVVNQLRKVIISEKNNYYFNFTLLQKTDEIQLYSIDINHIVAPHLDLIVYKPLGTTDIYLFYIKVKYILTFNAKVMIYPNDKQVMVRIQHNLNSSIWNLAEKALKGKLGI